MDVQKDLIAVLEKKLIDRGIPVGAAIKSGGWLYDCIVNGRYNDIVAPWNKNSREIFTELTGVKLPKSEKGTKKVFFNCKPFEVII